MRTKYSPPASTASQTPGPSTADEERLVQTLLKAWRHDGRRWWRKFEGSDWCPSTHDDFRIALMCGHGFTRLRTMPLIDRLRELSKGIDDPEFRSDTAWQRYSRGRPLFVAFGRAAFSDPKRPTPSISIDAFNRRLARRFPDRPQISPDDGPGLVWLHRSLPLPELGRDLEPNEGDFGALGTSR